MRIKRVFSEYENFVLGLSGGIKIVPDLSEYLTVKEFHLFNILLKKCETVSIGEKYITFNFKECAETNADLAFITGWSLGTLIKWSNKLEKLGFICTQRKSHMVVRTINHKLIYDTQKRIGADLLFAPKLLRKVCKDKHLSQITDDDIKAAQKIFNSKFSK